MSNKNNECKLHKMIEMQEKFEAELGYDFSTMTTEELVAYIKEYSIHLTNELHEMLNELPYVKPWKRYPINCADEQVMFAKARLEYIDLIHHVLNIGIALDLSADDIFQVFVDKNAVNYERQQNTYEYKKCTE